jgi:integrase
MLACCAFAVFLLQQLLAPLVVLRERLFGKAQKRANTAVLWAPGAAAAAGRATRPHGLRPTLALMLMLETVAVGGSVGAASLAAHSAKQTPEQQLLIALHTSICRALGRPAP